ncbi:MAG: C45 family peptidase [Chitinophagaceae bacterium]
MKILKRIGQLILIFISVLIASLLIIFLYVLSIPECKEPTIEYESKNYTLQTADSNKINYGPNWIRQNNDSLYEMYLEGNPYEIGNAYGHLAKSLIYEQEKAFTSEIKHMIPSEKYLKFLKYMIRFMNKNLSNYVLPEYQEEIAGISKAASSEFDWIGSKYSRQLNYHAAHDIGHALANMMLVGCTSFATWGQASADSTLIVGRNFDFYVGDEFAKHKIICFYKPTHGYPFMSIIWGGFTGVVSGMNNQGVTVTINANKSSIPFGSATPVSLVAREIVQYASNLQEAIAIAKKRKMFVSESFLISSAHDHKAIVIEKTPEEIDIYESDSSYITCTNHYQSKLLSKQELNKIQIQNSASLYRSQRLHELLIKNGKNNVTKTAAILRDYKGIQDQDIGLTNEKAINQFIAHHSIIFQPYKQYVWISTTPWQEGKYICYDLQAIFSKTSSYRIANKDIPADTFLQSSQYQQLKKYLESENNAKYHKPVMPSDFINSNPNYYDAYRLAGDTYMLLSQKDSARYMYKKALQYEIATKNEENSIHKKIKAIDLTH